MWGESGQDEVLMQMEDPKTLLSQVNGFGVGC
jgi:hypothetical protein